MKLLNILAFIVLKITFLSHSADSNPMESKALIELIYDITKNSEIKKRLSESAEYLNLSSLGLTSLEGLEKIIKPETIKYLNLDNNKIEDIDESFVSLILSLKNLKSISLINNPLSGESLEALADLVLKFQSIVPLHIVTRNKPNLAVNINAPKCGWTK
ncbi:MAG: hypothetical protein P4L22_07590 [Candidatus Babeliales bacterium]|nr:hypothetical protein [Candidatus Babeliales bacterium]